jgi:hypothetical protein
MVSKKKDGSHAKFGGSQQGDEIEENLDQLIDEPTWE